MYIVYTYKYQHLKFQLISFCNKRTLETKDKEVLVITSRLVIIFIYLDHFLKKSFDQFYSNFKLATRIHGIKKI